LTIQNFFTLIQGAEEGYAFASVNDMKAEQTMQQAI